MVLKSRERSESVSSLEDQYAHELNDLNNNERAIIRDFLFLLLSPPKVIKIDVTEDEVETGISSDAVGLPKHKMRKAAKSLRTS